MPRRCLTMIAVATFSLSLLLLPGCSSVPHVANPPTARDAMEHIIRVNEKGILLRLDGAIADDAYLDRHIVGPIREAMLTQASRYHKGVLVFVHGGLNDYDDAYAHFHLRFRALEAAGYYSLFVMWPSGLKGTYLEHLLRIRQGRREAGRIGSTFAAVTLPLVLVQDLGTGMVRTPLTTLHTLRADLQTAIPPNTKYGEADAVGIYRKLVAHQFPVEIGNDYKTSAEMTGRGASYIVTLPTKLATAGPIIDALGRPAWDDMLRRTYMVYPGVFADNEQRSSGAPVSSMARQVRKAEARRSGFANIVNELERLQGEKMFGLTLVGHSMGTIILNHLLDSTRLIAHRVVYLAAACSVRDYAESVLPYVAAHPETTSYNLSLHPMAEDGEWQRAWLDLPPRGSLLVWIDNFLSNPVYEQERTFGRWSNLFMPSPTGNSAIEDILLHRGTEGRVHFRAFGVGEGKTPRGPRYQWNTFNSGPPPAPPDEFTPERHSEMAWLEFWRDDIIRPIPSSGGTTPSPEARSRSPSL